MTKEKGVSLKRDLMLDGSEGCEKVVPSLWCRFCFSIAFVFPFSSPTARHLW